MYFHLKREVADANLLQRSWAQSIQENLAAAGEENKTKQNKSKGQTSDSHQAPLPMFPSSIKSQRRLQCFLDE